MITLVNGFIAALSAILVMAFITTWQLVEWEKNTLLITGNRVISKNVRLLRTENVMDTPLTAIMNIRSVKSWQVNCSVLGTCLLTPILVKIKCKMSLWLNLFRCWWNFAQLQPSKLALRKSKKLLRKFFRIDKKALDLLKTRFWEKLYKLCLDPLIYQGVSAPLFTERIG